ncbi:related to flavin-binding monooxygenase [Phialocephala subalpina]|uniref:Related to flavin-binding monooxygenase n=1 Tax=Phialocephala subalpina TaxID=576137 RepID=A0A1L7WLD0_9HELO|nr:related to flavin-binding monooxygenase [Phialocephala subalpina]
MWAAPKLLKENFKGSTPAPFEFDPRNPNDMSRRAIDNLRSIKVSCLEEAFPRNIKNLELVIYEKNSDLGGTWFESRYPGVACDVPSHTYQFTFESNSQWSSYWAPGAEIQAYLKSTAAKYDVVKFMKFNHLAETAVWDDHAGKWNVAIKNLKTGDEFTDTADILCSAVGALNKWIWPDIKGLHSFEGKLMHSANYDPNFDVTGKRIALIGGGSSGIQILPNIQSKAARVDHYMKGKTWIPPMGLGGQGLMDRGGDPKTPAEDLARFKDPKTYLEYRHQIESVLHIASDAIYKGTENAKMFQKMCEDNMRAKLAKKPEIFESLLPDFAPACRRLTPGPGYLEALVEDNVEFVSTNIKEVYEHGIVTEDGRRREVDAIICATGFAGYKQHFPLIGKDGVNLQDLWNEDITEAYLAMAAQKMPNYFTFLGPNGGPGIGSTALFLEYQGWYMVKCIQKIQREWIKSMVVKKSAVKAFGKYIDRFFEPTVFNSTCRSWWRHHGIGRLLAVWPGSALHGMYAWENPRWEDYDYELKDELEGNILSWLGNGYITSQIEGLKTTGYLDEAYMPVENPLEIKATNTVVKNYQLEES